MKTILISSLSVLWAVFFALGSFRAIGMDTSHGAATVAALGTAYALAATLFAWSAVSGWGAAGRRERSIDDASRFAFAGAAVAFAVSALLERGGGPNDAVLLQLAALGVTYLVIRAEAAGGRIAAAPDYSRAVARRMAADAAHGSMLSRLSRRGANPAENDS